MNRIKLDVPVHVAIGNEGTPVLIVGDLEEIDLTMEEFVRILHSSAIKEEEAKAAPEPEPVVTCRWCSRPAVGGKRVCKVHIKSLQRSAAKARAAKRRAA